MELREGKFAVDVLTAHYRVYGELRTLGDPFVFLNSANVLTLSIRDAIMVPLRDNMKLGSLSVDELHIPRTEPQIITLGNYEPSIKPLPKEATLICFTDTFLLRGTFHMSQSTNVEDVFYGGNRQYYPVTDVDIHAVYPLAVDVTAHSALAYLRGNTVRAFYRDAPSSEEVAEEPQKGMSLREIAEQYMQMA